MARIENGSDATVCRPGAILNPSRIEELVSLGIHRREVDQHICSLPNVLISIAKKFDGNFTVRWFTKPRDLKQETGNNKVILGICFC